MGQYGYLLNGAILGKKNNNTEWRGTNWTVGPMH